MKKQFGLMTLSLMLAAPSALAGGAGAPVARPAACQSIANIIRTTPQLSTLNSAVTSAGLQSALSGQGSYTVFAPSNAAFAKLPSDTLANTLSDTAALRNLLSYHVVGERATAAQLRGVQGGTTLQGADVRVSTRGNQVVINNATVTRADIVACNGVVHIIDTVLMPPVATVTAPVAAPVAISAPIVIPALPPRATITNTSGTSTVVTAPATPVETTVTTPVETTQTTVETPATTETTTTKVSTTEVTTETTATETTTEGTSLYDVISANDDYSTFRDLLSDAGLTETLMSEGSYTLLIPTNAAFDAMPAETLAAISSDPTALRNFLSYYIISSTTTAEQLATGNVVTLAGNKFVLGTAKLGQMLTGSNGVYYTVDSIVLPEGFQVPQVAAIAADTSAMEPNVVAYLNTDTRFSTFRGLLVTAGLADTLTSGQYTVFAPTNDAFAKVPADALSALAKDKARLTAFLRRYLVTSTNPLAVGNVTPVEGDAWAITQDGTTFRVGNANVVGNVTTTGNGNIYVIDTVTLP